MILLSSKLTFSYKVPKEGSSILILLMLKTSLHAQEELCVKNTDNQWVTTNEKRLYDLTAAIYVRENLTY